MFNNQKIIKQKAIFKSRQGFTILEVIVVLFIISLGLVGVLSLVTQTIQVEYVNKSTLIASELAQEGLELARNKRDYNWLNGPLWNTGIADGAYTVENTNPPTLTLVDAVNTGILNIAASGYYTHGAGSASIFRRIINISNTNISSTTVSVRVSWTERGRTHNYIAETVLYDWK